MTAQKVMVLLLVAAAVLWNGWVLAIFVYPHTTWLHMEISELSIPAQPWSWVFRTFDGLSALCMLGAGALLLSTKQLPRYWAAAGGILLVVLSLLTFFDITHSLDCVQYAHPACVAHVATNNISWHDHAHQAESKITSYTSIVFALWLVGCSLWLKQHAGRVVVAALCAAGIITTLAILQATGNLFVYAVSDRAWNLFVSAGLLLLSAIVAAQAQKT